MELSFKTIIVIAAAVAIIGTGAIYYLAVMNKPTHTVTVQIIGNGQVLLGTTGAYSTIIQVNDGESLKITAKPDSGWVFNSWSGDATGNVNPLDLVVTKDMQITAIFTKQ